MSDLGRALWPFFVVIILTATILLLAVTASLIIGRRRLIEAHRRFVHRLLTVQYEERSRVAAEVHAGLTHRVSLLQHEITDWRRRGHSGTVSERDYRFIEQELAEFNQLARRFARKLHPTSLDSAGLRTALETLIEELRRTTGLKVQLECAATGLPKGRLGYSIFGVVQEALQNVIRHAEVLEAWVTVRVEGEWIVVEVRDEGVGFQPLPPTEASVDGIGLLTMRERTQLEGGAFDLRANSGGGTRVVARFPMTERTDA